MRKECDYWNADKVTIIDLTCEEIQHIPEGAPLKYVGDRDKVDVDKTKEEVFSIVTTRRFGFDRIVNARTLVIAQAIMVSLKSIFQDIWEKYDQIRTENGAWIAGDPIGWIDVQEYNVPSGYPIDDDERWEYKGIKYQVNYLEDAMNITGFASYDRLLAFIQ